ncbi:MAG TPA: transcription-repair coupling factor [Bacteroidales bacterium]|nr:transcription-repair coupling factor [Bacteroidales bacterium]
MDFSALYQQKHPRFLDFISSIKNKPNARAKVSGIAGSSRSAICSAFFKEINTSCVFLLNEYEDAAYFASDLLNYFEEDSIVFFPSSYRRPGHSIQEDASHIIRRTEALKRLTLSADKPLLVVTYPEALAERVGEAGQLKKSMITLHSNEKVDLAFLKETLKELGFERSDFVISPGQYSVRGSIVDVYSFSAKFPYRIDFFGNEVDSIRSFDLETQLSVDKLDKIDILPDLKKNSGKGNMVSFFSLLPPDSVVWAESLTDTFRQVNELQKGHWIGLKPEEDGRLPIVDYLVDEESLIRSIQPFKIIETSSVSFFKSEIHFEFSIRHQPNLNKNFDLLVSSVKQYKQDGYEVYICSDQPKQLVRIEDIVKSIDKEAAFVPLEQSVHEGFIDEDLKIAVFTEHQIFGRYQKIRYRNDFAANQTFTLSEITDLHPGDFIVHIDHGVGRFGGIEKVEINGHWQEVIKLVYRDNDVLYVSIHSLHRISKYKGKDGEPPSVHKLGSGAWQKTKAVAKSKVKDIAKDLIALYAKRKESPGFAYSPDSFMQEELEASFIYEDTPDQEKATMLVKQGMERDYPMDMLVCGDVGFGKTEIAIRAAFKAVADNKQVAVLVPTTILALQHFKTFSERLKGFPCKVDFISRMRKPKDIREILKKLKEGDINILIGTHKLLSKDIEFKDLGLLIIDEEQKFGVAMKEKLKQLKLNIDTLTLTATPIPRTLQFSLMGARDLAIINTPPPNRHPIVTEVHSFNETIIREGIMYELMRGGQVFFLNNRIANLSDLQMVIRKLVPEARTVIAHGQMDPEKLEEIILDFIDGQYDVLIATAIIESGIDISNANTIFINDAHHFGLSDLHQLRGRVGRSNKKAFCYLLTPPVTTLTSEARRRLKAIEDFSELGSGFSIAMQDLDIRGAGNLLGAEQSGFIAEIGYETYQRILNEAIQELKESDFKDLFYNEKTETQIAQPSSNVLNNVMYITDCQIDTDLEILIPEVYVESITERIKLYRELDNLQTDEDLAAFVSRLADRFGPVPQSCTDLIDVVRLRRMALQLGFERIVLKNKQMVIYFIANQKSPYYQSPVFIGVLNAVNKNPKVFRMKESKDKLIMSVDNISKVGQAIDVIRKLNMD